jgi:hypothetical protein
LPSTSVENPLQINSFYAKQTQFPKKSNEVSFFYTKDYENKSDWTLGKNKPNSNPDKPNFKPGDGFSAYYTRDCHDPPGYGEGLCRDESGLARPRNDIFGSFPAKSGCPA